MEYLVVNTSFPEIAAIVSVRIVPAQMSKSPVFCLVLIDFVIQKTAISAGRIAQTINFRLLS